MRSNEKTTLAASASEHEQRPSVATTVTAVTTTTIASRQPLLSASGDIDAATEAGRKLEKRLVRKLDLCMLPVLILMTLFQVVDRSLIGTAAISGLPQDLQLTSTQFNSALSVFQAGFLLLQLPSNAILPRLRPSLYLSGCCLLWSTVAVCHAFVTSYKQLIAVRVLLGMCDAPFQVGAIYLLSCWYKRDELAKRTSAMLGWIVIGLVALDPATAGILAAMSGRNGWNGWRWLYIVFGGAGVGIAVLGWLLLPDWPGADKRRWWLSKEEQDFARERIEEDRVGRCEVEKRKIWTGLKDSVKDGRTWIFVVMFVSRKSLEGLYYYLLIMINSFVPSLLPHLGLPQASKALLLEVPPALVAALLAFALGHTSDKYTERTFHMATPLFVGLVGLIMSVFSMDATVRYVTIYLYLPGGVAGSGLAWGWVANTIQETPEKKACALAIINVLGGLGAVWSPFFFRKEDKPGYKLAFQLICGFVSLDIICCLLMRWILRRQNVRLRREAEQRHDGEGESSQVKLYVL